MSRPNPPSPVIQILLILASALAGCVYVPLSTEKYPGELDKPHINEMIGESVQAIETRLGKPTLRFRYRDSKYFVYRYPVKQKAFMAGVAPIGGPTLFIPVPFAGVVTEDVDICVRIEFDHDRKMVNYDVGALCVNLIPYSHLVG